MPKNPDPSIKLTSSKGQTRTLDDWSTMFHLTLVILPPRPEAARYIPIAERIFKVFGDADCRTAFVVTGNEFIARGVLGDAEDRYMTFCRSRRRVRHQPRAHAPPGARAPAPGHHAARRRRGLGPARVATGRESDRQGVQVVTPRGGRPRRPCAHAGLARLTCRNRLAPRAGAMHKFTSAHLGEPRRVR